MKRDHKNKERHTKIERDPHKEEYMPRTENKNQTGIKLSWEKKTTFSLQESVQKRSKKAKLLSLSRLTCPKTKQNQTGGGELEEKNKFTARIRRVQKRPSSSSKRGMKAPNSSVPIPPPYHITHMNEEAGRAH